MLKRRQHFTIVLAVSLFTFIGCDHKSASIEGAHANAVSELHQGAKPDPLLVLTLPELTAKLQSGELSAESLVASYLVRIEVVDRSGPRLQSVITVNPDALKRAKALDAMRAEGRLAGPLHGVPVLIKDNIETADNMPTTAGSLALRNNFSGRDSPLVAGLRDAGAIILGKTNLSQWANFRSENSISGWSSVGGQVRNPHMLDRSPCGSSSGSGAAAAASLAAGAVGTETNGSISCPSHVNGIVGFKPSVGLVSQQYIVPISSHNDTAGPMTKTVTGAAMLLNAMATADHPDFVAALDASALNGKRVGVLRFAEGNNPAILERFNAALAAMAQAGATLVEIADAPPSLEQVTDHDYLMMKYEFKALLNDYLASTPPIVKVRTLAQLIEFNNANASSEMALFGQEILEASAQLPGLDSPDYIAARDLVERAMGEQGIDWLMTTYGVDILVSPTGPITPRIDPINGDVWPQWVGAGYMAANAGYPHLTVPMGTVHQLPLGISFIAGRGQDAEVLSIGFSYEQATYLRPEPAYVTDAESLPDINHALAR